MELFNTGNIRFIRELELKKLKKLDLENKKINRINDITVFENIEILFLGENRINNIDLRPLKNLFFLEFNDNKVVEVKNLFFPSSL